MADNFYSKVPHNLDHSHFGNQTIDSFPDLHADASFDRKAFFIRESLKHQLLTTRPEQAKRCTSFLYTDYNLRECFKFTQKSHVQHCLKSKAPGVTLEEAAK